MSAASPLNSASASEPGDDGARGGALEEGTDERAR